MYRLFKDNIKHLKYKVWNRLNRSKVIHQVFQRFRSNLAYSYIKNPTPLNDILVASLIRLNNIQCQFLCSFTTWKVNRCIILVDVIMKDLFFSRRGGNFLSNTTNVYSKNSKYKEPRDGWHEKVSKVAQSKISLQ